MKLPTFEVSYYKSNGEVDRTAIIRPVPITQLKDVKILCEKLIEKFVFFDRVLADLLLDSETIEFIKKLAAMLPEVGGGVGIDFDSIANAGDIATIGAIFFSESIKPDMITPGWNDEQGLYYNPEHRRIVPKPSSIARIHDIDFFKIFIKFRVKQEEDEEAKNKEEQKTSRKKSAETGNAT